MNASDVKGPWFKVGQRVLVSGAGTGRIVEVEDLHREHEGYRYYRVNFGPTRCRCCGHEQGDRVKSAMAIHISLTVGERKRLKEAG